MRKAEEGCEPVQLPPAPGGRIDVRAIEAAAWDWVVNPAFTALVAAFGGPRQEGDLACHLGALEDFSAIWDFRGGQERNLARPEVLSSEAEKQILEAASILGLRDGFNRPAPSRFDHCLILGGMIRACALRPAWAAELARSGVRFGDVAALGGFRQLGGDEPAVARAAGMGDVADELHAMDAGLRRAFGVAGDPVVEEQYEPADPNSSWAVHRFDHDAFPLCVVAAPSSQPHIRRANTADSYAWWAKNIANLTAEHRVLLVTSSIYVPFQHADAVRMLAAVYGCGVETVGVPTEWTTGHVPQQEFTASNYLQEMRSAIRSLRMLVQYIRQI